MDYQKSFGKIKAVNDISFYVEEGSLFSFLGTNGAGKSTTISILLTLLQQDEGHVIINGYTVGKHDQAIRREIGVVFQESLLDPLLTVKENLGFADFLSDDEARATRCDYLSYGYEWIDCSFRNRPYGKLSGGQHQRLILHVPLFINLTF